MNYLAAIHGVITAQQIVKILKTTSKIILGLAELLTADERQRLFAPVWDVKHIDPKAIFGDVFSKHENELNKAEDYINPSLILRPNIFAWVICD